MADSKIIEKITKLLALAEEGRGGTEAERELATKRAQELMLKHNIEHGELTGQSAPGDVDKDEDVIQGSTSEWKVNLILGLGSVCFVDGYYIPMGRFQWRVVQVGRADNIAFVNTLVKHLMPWLEDEAAQGFKKAKLINPDVKVRSFKRAFYSSATARIRLRLEVDRNALGSKGMELVRNERAANEAWMREQGIHLRTSRRRGYSSADGHAAGTSAGNRADLSPGRKLTS